ncbi:hypothetical protein VP395_08180 [Mariniflexile soesokkakense]|uniref:Uncharacterized protein n=1 Tax=Mariniflexile soesokkakense TaxID=1343160 RepID=A0ABV0ABY9_9FLAO
MSTHVSSINHLFVSEMVNTLETIRFMKDINSTMELQGKVVLPIGK